MLVIRGVAGSGKTSIALQRIAFLLYRFRDTLSSEDILLIDEMQDYTPVQYAILARLFDSHSAAVAGGVIVMSAHLAKGLEFDQVIVPETDAVNYADAMDRNLLYVACTRAMHRLTLTCVGETSEFIIACQRS